MFALDFSEANLYDGFPILRKRGFIYFFCCCTELCSSPRTQNDSPTQGLNYDLNSLIDQVFRLLTIKPLHLVQICLLYFNECCVMALIFVCPIGYRQDASTECTRTIADLSTECESNPILSARSYFTGFEVVKVNSLVCEL